MNRFCCAMCLLISFSGQAQNYDSINDNSEYDSLLRERNRIANDTNKVKVLNSLGNYHKFSRPDSGIFYATKGLELSKALKMKEQELYALHTLRLSHYALGNYITSYRIALEGLRKSEEYHSNQKAWFLLDLGGNMANNKNYQSALDYHRMAYVEFEKLQEYNFVAIAGAFLGQSYFRVGKLDSAFTYCYQAKQLAENLNISWVRAPVYDELAEIHKELNHVDSALHYFKLSNSNKGSSGGKSFVLLEIAKLLDSMNHRDSAAYYAEMSLKLALENKLYRYVSADAIFFSNFYEQSDPVKALQYNKMALAYRDSLEAMSKMTGFADLIDFDEQQRKAELEKANEEYQSKLRTNIYLGSTFTLLVIAFFLYRNNRNKQKAKQKIEQAYDQLKATQSQLIQSEKMASLGELTAGIAHEIQNPLNFVNNFSEVNEELLSEMKEELNKGKIDEAIALANDAIENQKKINHHGKRADAIVKGMLQHSRGSNDVKEPTDINALADEYLRLAYHGLRAKDKSFNAKFETEFDAALPKINVVPQDIGRVILNLITNAFYAVNEKRTTNKEAYEPIVTVSTISIGSKIEISVKDNGNGIPESVKEKIFQPFFTTKPTGQGTGLGLSMSYDIIKSHGGDIRVNSDPGLGSEFIITLIRN